MLLLAYRYPRAPQRSALSAPPKRQAVSTELSKAPKRENRTDMGGAFQSAKARELSPGNWRFKAHTYTRRFKAHTYTSKRRDYSRTRQSRQARQCRAARSPRQSIRFVTLRIHHRRPIAHALTLGIGMLRNSYTRLARYSTIMSTMSCA